jgi:hypothetical protein
MPLGGGKTWRRTPAALRLPRRGNSARPGAAWLRRRAHPKRKPAPPAPSPSPSRRHWHGPGGPGPPGAKSPDAGPAAAPKLPREKGFRGGRSAAPGRSGLRPATAAAHCTGTSAAAAGDSWRKTSEDEHGGEHAGGMAARPTRPRGSRPCNGKQRRRMSEPRPPGMCPASGRVPGTMRRSATAI